MLARTLKNGTNERTPFCKRKLENIYSPTIDTIKDNINQRLNHEQLFNSRKDTYIAKMLLEKLATRYETSKIDQKNYLDGLNALNTLIPTWDERRKKRKIADISISPVMEKTIASRLHAKEIDIMGPEGAWGRLPEEVKLEIAKHNHFTVEMTSTCTVKCHFCAFAKKGPIKQKISLISLEELLRYSTKHQVPDTNIYKQDAFYSGSDPFDIKWMNTTKKEDFDYSDFMRIYDKLTRGKQRFMFTSTSLPIGEEMRIINAIDQMIKDQQSGKASKLNEFRISKTYANEKRVNAMEKLFNALYDNNLEADHNIYISNIVDENVSLAGKGWLKPNLNPSIYDIMGPGCQDDLIIGLNQVDAVVMEASSNERPNGETRFPILKDMPDGNKVYSIPVPYRKPDKETPLAKMYPDIKMTTITMPKNGSVKKEVITIETPHRTFLRMLAVLRRIILLGKRKPANINNMTSLQKARFKQLSSKDAKTVQDHLDLGNENVSMRTWMKFLKAKNLL